MYIPRKLSRFLTIGSILLTLQLTCGVALSLDAKRDIDDVGISDAVFDELAHDQVVETYWIDVISDDGIVTLSGRVSNILAKERAAHIAGTIKGVRGVVNMLDVIPPVAISDKRLKVDVKNALLSDPATDLFEIGVSVSDGTVMLSGEVGSWQEKRLCAVVAKSVKGVTDVQNGIVFRTDDKRLDDEIRVETEQGIAWDSLIDDSKVKVTVIDGRVILEGVVGSLAEKRRIIDHAFLAEASEVNAKGLEIAWWKREDENVEKRDFSPTEQEIRTAVRDVLFHDPRVSPFHIIIEVDRGEVTLRGTVDNMKAKQAAFRSAENTVGVARVINRLRVRPTAVYLDADIKDEVQRSLRRDPFVPLEEIRIAVYSGVVELSGSVDTSFERSRAEELAMRVNGVVGVNNNIQINRAPVPLPYNPYVDDWYAQESPYPDDTDRTESTKSDADIARDVENELYWSPFVDSENIEVDVEGGVVTLRGTFLSRSEFYAATKNAYDGGAVAVNNELVYKAPE